MTRPLWDGRSTIFMDRALRHQKSAKHRQIVGAGSSQQSPSSHNLSFSKRTRGARGKLPDSATLRDLVLVVRAAGAAVIEKPLVGDEVNSAISRLLEARKAA